MNDITFSLSTDTLEAKKDTIEKFNSLIKEEFFEETILETEQLNELREIESFLSVLDCFIRFAISHEAFEEFFTPLVKHAYWVKSRYVSSEHVDDSPSPSQEDFQRLAKTCNGIYSDSGLIEFINNSASLAELNSIVSLLIDLEFVIRTARAENCWTELKSLMIQLIDRKIL